MLVGQTLVEFRLSSFQIDGWLTRQDKELNATFYVDNAGDMLFGIDDIAGRLHEAHKPDVDRAGWQAAHLAGVKFLDHLAAREHIGVGGCWRGAPARDERHRENR